MMDNRFTKEEYIYWLKEFPVIVSHWENDIANLKSKYVYVARTGQTILFDADDYAFKKSIIDAKYIEILRSLTYGENEQEPKGVN